MLKSVVFWPQKKAREVYKCMHVIDELNGWLTEWLYMCTVNQCAYCLTQEYNTSGMFWIHILSSIERVLLEIIFWISNRICGAAKCAEFNDNECIKNAVEE